MSFGDKRVAALRKKAAGVWDTPKFDPSTYVYPPVRHGELPQHSLVDMPDYQAGWADCLDGKGMPTQCSENYADGWWAAHQTKVGVKTGGWMDSTDMHLEDYQDGYADALAGRPQKSVASDSYNAGYYDAGATPAQYINADNFPVQSSSNTSTFATTPMYAYTTAQMTWMPKLAYGETIAPPQVDTLAPDSCPICGADDFNGEECPICSYIRPPDQYMDPDLEMAQQTDLRQDQNDPDVAADELMGEDPNALLECELCGHSVPDADGVSPDAPQTPQEPGGQVDASPGATPNTSDISNPPGATPQNPAQDPQPPDAKADGTKPPTKSPNQTQPPGAEMSDAPVPPPDPQNGPTPPPNNAPSEADKPPAGKALPKKKDDQPGENDDKKSETDADPSKPSDPDSSDKPDAGSADSDPSAGPPGADSPDASAKTDSAADQAPDGDKPDADSDSGKVNPDGSNPADLPAAHEGDPCPSCGKGTLTKKQADEFNSEEDALQSGDETEGEIADDADGGHFPGDDPSDPSDTSDGSDDPGPDGDGTDEADGDDDKPPWLKDKKNASIRGQVRIASLNLDQVTEESNKLVESVLTLCELAGVEV